ncbi:D-2-hydroxyacid dehydrogenase [Mobilitalea sibirica]|uniref:D-2-hydroxyacid dehydrogenase n=1 Tax=Mobilitalea sibirica TaxID=1462919 RepID=A0A8J7H0R2_9FIRM|nr:D-2-hydroxyacid dehydrogenase [Mobilitalea sibirica]MBH1939495.1 D-2-hydroxyacid dehydrogenase [Mobilitalea sibirica]
MKIVVLDGYTENPGDLSWDGLAELGDLVVYDRTPEELVIERIGDAEIVYSNKTVISEEILAKCQNIKFIGVLATGYNVIDVKAAKSRGIVVSNIPSYGTDAVAQYTMALLLELCHHIGDHSNCVKKGDWTNSQDFCFWNYPLIELVDKTMGIIGFGKIGQATAKIARAFGMKILTYNPSPIDKDQLDDNIEQVSFEELLEGSDVISLHCPLFPETKGIINKETISKMKDRVLIINDSRGPLIVEEDLRDALISGKVAGAAVDVVSTEPIRMDNPLLSAPNIIITPHIAWAPKEARQRLMNIAVENLKAFIQGSPINTVA